MWEALLYTLLVLFLILSFIQNICILSEVELVISILIINISKLSFLCRWCIIRSHLPSAFYCLQVYEEEFEDSGIKNESINRRTDNTMAKRKRTNNDLQNIHIKDRVTRNPLKTGGKLRWPGRVGSSCSTSGTHRVNLVTKPVISHEYKKRPGSVYDKWNISVVICDTYIS